MNNQKVKLTNKLVNGFKSNTFTADGKKGKAYFIQEETAPGFKSNTFTADGKKGKAYFIQEETAPGLNLRVQPTWE